METQRSSNVRVLILANGDTPSRELAHRLVRQHDLLIATDGAVHRAAGLQLCPHIVCGDFDSALLERAQQEFPEAEFIPTPDQDHADLEKAIQVALNRGASRITVIGATGGRLDFTLANMALLLRYYTEVELQVVDDTTVVHVVGSETDRAGEVVLDAQPGERVSLLSLSGQAHVSITGVEWPLQDYPLPVGTRGVSNVVRDHPVIVRARRGAVLVFHFPGSSTS